MSERSGGRLVTAVIVAYNRRDLLAETLDALAGQTRALDRVVVVDNASTDDSAAVAASYIDRLPLDVVRLERNTGGAGGFAAGMAVALDAEPADWIWLMDDDTVPEPEALAALLGVVEPGGYAVGGSRVVWVDGREHPMNTPRSKPFASRGERSAAERYGSVPIRTTSFVSMLIRADVVRQIGLPIADYFIWNDDFEYSARALRGRRGVHVPASVVVHKTKELASTDADPGERFFFEVRNKLWLFRFSQGLTVPEKVMYGASSVRRWLRTYLRSRERSVIADGWRRGRRDGLRSRPRRNAQALSGLGQVTIAVEAFDGVER